MSNAARRRPSSTERAAHRLADAVLDGRQSEARELALKLQQRDSRREQDKSK